MIRPIPIMLAVVCSAAIASADGPPRARVAEVTDDYFGKKIVDAYRWMESGGDELKRWMTAQGDYTTKQLAAVRGRGQLLARVRELSLGTSRVTIGAVAGPYRFLNKIAAGEQLRKLVVSDAHGHERTLVDPERRTGHGGHVSLDNYSPSFDGKLVACNLAEGGGEITTIHIFDTATGRELPDRIERVWGEMQVNWLPDGKRFFYTQMAPVKPGVDPLLGERVFLHVVGRPTAEDALVLAPGKDQSFPFDPVEFPTVRVQPGTNWLIAEALGARSERRIAVAKLADLHGDKTVWRRVADYSDGIEDAVIIGTDLVVSTRNGAPNRRFLRVPLANPDLARAEVLVPEDPRAFVHDFAVTRNALYIIDQIAGRARLRKLEHGAKQPVVVSLPEEGWVPSLTTNPLTDDWYLSMVTWTKPLRIFHATAKGFIDTGLGERSPADYSDIAVEEVEVTADDGEKVPLTILAKKGLARDGSHPAILNGYGGYGVSILPSFDGSRLAWLERGGVLAYAHVRGGGEKGYRWQTAGKSKNKPRGIKDFHACAEYLVEQRWTTRARLAATGGSMGGVLIGRAITERPDLFGVAVISVGMLNVLRYLDAPNGANQTAELGATPATRDGVDTLLAMDAYQNLKAGVAYPAVMLVVGANDQRVVPWASAKFAARLQALSPQRPALLRVDSDAGHGIGSTRDQSVIERTDGWSFILWQTGDPAFQPKN